jgi:threonyl-tRNA synthetase
LEYTGADGAKHRPVMIHRGLLSSMERMVALLIERYAGRMPPWLAPMQVSVLPVEDGRHGAAAVELRELLLANGVRARVLADGTLGARIRQARQHRDAYLAVLGDAELAQGSVQVNREQVKIAEFVDRVAADIRDRVKAPS